MTTLAPTRSCTAGVVDDRVGGMVSVVLSMKWFYLSSGLRAAFNSSNVKLKWVVGLIGRSKNKSWRIKYDC